MDLISEPAKQNMTKTKTKHKSHLSLVKEMSFVACFVGYFCWWFCLKMSLLFLAKRGRRPRVAGFIILSLKGLRRDEISCGVYGHIYLFIYLRGWCMPEVTSHGRALVA